MMDRTISYLFFVLMVTFSLDLVKGSIEGSASNEKIEDCHATIKPEVNSYMNVTYYSKKSVIKNRLKIVMNKGKTFADILNSNCPKFPEIFLEYREKSAENVPWTKVKAYKKASRQINLKHSSTYGEVKLPRGKEIDFCKSYDMRFS